MTDLHTLSSAKKAARAHAVAVRRAACMADGPAAAESLVKHAPALNVQAGAVVAGYWPMGDEMDPRPLMQALSLRGCVLALPVVQAPGQALTFRAWNWGDSLAPGGHGTLHPAASAPQVTPEVVLTPLLSYDRACFRLGYGGGYYDRTLAGLRGRVPIATWGIAFAAQEVEAVPRDGYDQGLDGILTEREIIKAVKP